MAVGRVEVGLVVIAVFVRLTAAALQVPPLPPPAVGYPSSSVDPGVGLPANKLAEEVYANIRALNGVPYGEVIPGMQVMSEALGVDCEHCHSESGDRDVEGNPNKDIARDMIRMVRDLNQRSFGGRNVISCYTCHRGSIQPTAVPALAANMGLKPSENASAPPIRGFLPSAGEVIDKYISAIGSADLMKTNSSRVEIGTLTIRSAGDQKIPIEIVSLTPDKRYTKGFSVSHLGNSAQAMGVVNGNLGWMRESNGPVRLMFGWRRDAAQLEDLLNLPQRIGTLLREVRVARREEVGGSECIVLTGRTDFLPLVELFFDDRSGLLSRTMYYVDSTVGRMPSRIDYSDYHIAGGLKVPFHWDVTLVRGVRVSYQLSSVKQNVAPDAAAFALPNPPPKLYR